MKNCASRWMQKRRSALRYLYRNCLVVALSVIVVSACGADLPQPTATAAKHSTESVTLVSSATQPAAPTLTSVPTKSPTQTPGITPTSTTSPAPLSSPTSLLQPTATQPFVLDASWLPLPLPTISADNLQHIQYQTALGIVGETALSPDGKYIAINTQKKVNLYEFRTLKEISLPQDQLNLIGGWVTGIAFSPDSAMLAATYTSYDSTGVTIWQTMDGKLLYAYDDQDLDSLAFSPNGATLALGGYAQIFLLDLETMTMVRSWEAHTWIIDDITFSNDGRLLASVSRDNTLKVWDPVNGTELFSAEGEIPPDAEATYPGLNRVAFSADSRFLATGSLSGGLVQLWRVTQPFHMQPELTWQTVDNSIVGLTFSKDGSFLVTSSHNITQFWALPEGSLTRALKNVSGNVILSPDGSLLIIGNQFWVVK